MKKIQTITLTLILAANFIAKAQNKNYTAKKTPLTENQLKRWSHLDLEKDSIPGMSLDKAYNELLKDKKGKKIIVAVIDSGVDIEHEDLKSIVWTNSKEIPNNGIDDDKNGFIDDIYGWNFLGNAVKENLEMTRMLKKTDNESLTYKKAQAQFEEKQNKALDEKQQVDFMSNANKTIQDYLNKKDYTLNDVKNIKSSDNQILRAKMVMEQILANTDATSFNEELNGYQKYIYTQLNYNLNKDFDGRKIVGDNPNDIKDTKYGNNIVYGPDKEEALHGTHVAGIIAQLRNNNLGGDGIAENVEIMTIRAVPDGDEYDKDIALAIKYAVDNGAKIINGSFGKAFSPNKQWVYDALKYAEKKDVLFVHAAGNESNNIDLPTNPNFPNDSDDYKKEFVSNVLTVGAITKEYGKNIIAEYSNYGNFNVDVFAPGSEIYATIPNNKYKFEQGTSMASPNVAAVAALIRSHYPNLSAKEVKKIIIESGIPLPNIVQVGNDHKIVSSSETCKSGKIVNAYNALIMASKK